MTTGSLHERSGRKSKEAYSGRFIKPSRDLTGTFGKVTLKVI